MAIKLIIGLRNPGSAYENTRHNAGGWYVEALAEQYKLTFKVDKKLQTELAMLQINDKTCRLSLPLTFMNHSGIATQAVCQFYRLDPQEILVVHDDLDLSPGRIKLKTGGGHGGHNGLRDITNHLGTAEFHRLRIGIGHPGHKDLVLNYVLGKPSQVEKKLICEAINRAVVATESILTNVTAAMNELNS